MNDTMSFNISYDEMKKIIKKYFLEQGRCVNVKINNEIDSDRFNGSSSTSICLSEEIESLGFKFKAKNFLSIYDLKRILSFILSKEDKELVDLTDNAIVTSRTEGYGMGEHEVTTIANKSFTVVYKEKQKTLKLEPKNNN